MSQNTLTILTVPDPELAVTKIEIQMQGGSVLRPLYRATLFNIRNRIVDSFNHQITDGEWFSWALDVYDKPYLKKIILKRYAAISGVELALADEDDVMTEVDDEVDPPYPMIDAFNEYDDVITQIIAQEVIDAQNEAP